MKKLAIKNEEFVLTKKQQTEIRNRLMDVYENADPTKPKVSMKTQEDIRLAVNSGVKELFDLGCLTAMALIKPHYARLAVKYQDIPRTTVEDLVNAPLYETVRDNIKNYNAKYALITYFEKPVVSAFMKAREEARGCIMTKYYMDTSVIIKRAKRELERLGITEISDVDLSQWIKVKYNKNISAVTIGKIHDMTKNESSIDGMSTQIADPSMADPATIMMEKERQEEFQKSIKSLSERHSCFIEAALEYTATTGEAPKTAAQAYEICKTFLPNVTKEQALRLMRASFREFGRYHRRYRSDEIADNASDMMDDVWIMEREEYELNSYANAEEDSETENMVEEEIVMVDEY